MKKLIYITTILVAVVILTSCDTNLTTSSDTTVASEASVSSSQVVLSSSTSDTQETIDEIAGEASIIYRTFEETLEMANNVVIVEYLGKERIDRTFTEYKFNVCERLLGNADDEISIYQGRILIHMISDGKDEYSYLDDEYPMIVGHRYLLPLYGYNTVYFEKPRYYFLSGLAIDLTSLSQSVMYGKQNIASHVKGLNLNQTTVDYVQTYVKSIVQDNSRFNPKSDAKDLKELISMSPDIFVVKVGRVVDIIESPERNCELRDCVVKDILKTDDAEVLTEIAIKFFQNTVDEGDEVIVFLEGDGAMYLLSSRNTYVDCVQSVDKKEEFIAMIQSKE